LEREIKPMNTRDGSDDDYKSRTALEGSKLLDDQLYYSTDVL